MSLGIEKLEMASVFSPQGRIDGANAGALEAALLAAIDPVVPRIVLDLAQVEYISSAGLRVVVLVGKRLKQRGGKLVLCNLQALVLEVFEISGLVGLVAITGNRSAALAA